MSPLSKTLSLINECIRRRDGGGQLEIRGGRSRIKIGGRGVEKEGTGLAEQNVPFQVGKGTRNKESTLPPNPISGPRG